MLVYLSPQATLATSLGLSLLIHNTEIKHTLSFLHKWHSDGFSDCKTGCNLDHTEDLH